MALRSDSYWRFSPSWRHSVGHAAKVFCIAHQQYQRLYSRTVFRLCFQLGWNRFILFWKLEAGASCRAPFSHWTRYVSSHFITVRAPHSSRMRCTHRRLDETHDHLNISNLNALWPNSLRSDDDGVICYRMPSDINKSLFFGYFSNAFLPFVELINSCQNSRIKTSERKDESHVDRDCPCETE
jgi:hypothetical protein